MTLGEFQHQQVGERAIAGGHLAIRVAQQRKGSRYFWAKAAWLFLAVQADTDDFSPRSLSLTKSSRKLHACSVQPWVWFG